MKRVVIMITDAEGLEQAKRPRWVWLMRLRGYPIIRRYVGRPTG